MKDKFYNYILELQDSITSKLTSLDEKTCGNVLKVVVEERELLKTVLFLKKEVSMFLPFMVSCQKVCNSILELKMPIFLPAD